MKDLLLGTDICQISRIQKAVDKYGDKFLQKTFTPSEVKYALTNKRNVYERLSVRFATKEAVSKALGVGINKLGWGKGINWKEVEIIRGEMNNIDLSLTGRAKELADQKKVQFWRVSVSHMGDYAIATVAGIVENES
jgi:holo-[acyl-carrier protein] synthase